MPALDLENLHATPTWMALASRMTVMWGDEAVKGADNQWRAFGQWEDQLEAHRPDPTPDITAKAQELAAGAPDLYAKLSHITSYIQNNIRYFVVEKGIGGWQAHYAGDIYRNRYGDCKDKTTLLISMLQAVGIRAHYLVVAAGPLHGAIDPEAPSLIANHVITAIEIPAGESDPRLQALVKAANGKTLLIFDPTMKKLRWVLFAGSCKGRTGTWPMDPTATYCRCPCFRRPPPARIAKAHLSWPPTARLPAMSQTFSREWMQRASAECSRNPIPRKCMITLSSI
jgi:hypothetical protein